jgi:hypothetical protein
MAEGVHEKLKRECEVKVGKENIEKYFYQTQLENSFIYHPNFYELDEIKNYVPKKKKN